MTATLADRLTAAQIEDIYAEAWAQRGTEERVLSCGCGGACNLCREEAAAVEAAANRAAQELLS